MQFTLDCDAWGRVAGSIAQNGERATVTSSEPASALPGLHSAVENVLAEGMGECFWHEPTGDYRWLFRREGNKIRVVILWSTGTLTGWEHRFWAECETEHFRGTMSAALDACNAPGRA